MAQKRISLVVHDDEIVFASFSEVMAEDYAYNRLEADVHEMCEDDDIDIDGLDEDELAGLFFKSGYENGCYEVHTEMIEMGDGGDDIEYELPDGTTYYLSDVMEVLDNDDDDDDDDDDEYFF